MRQFAIAATVGAGAWLAVTAAANAQCTAPGTASTECTGNTCATITAPNATGPAGGSVNIPISFAQGPNDSQNGQGFDEVSAVAFTLGVPGSGDATPLTFNCTDGNLASDAVTGVPSNFTVVIENAQCTNRNRCLCPDTGAGQTRDNFVNIVVYGPRDLPEQGPVQIPVLPTSGNIVTLKMQIAAGATGTVPLHIFSAMDTGTDAKPQFAANLSIGDQAACDVTATTANKSNVKFVQGLVTIGGTPTAGCVGDCDGGGSVAISELVRGVNIALGSQPISNCTAFDCQNTGTVPVSCLVRGVNNSLNGCP
jgi:hypothetical protein